MMNKQDAFKFVHKVLDILIIDADVDAISAVYHTDAKLHIGNLTFNFDDIKNRINYLYHTYEGRHHFLFGANVVNDAIIFQVQQIMKDKRTDEFKVLTVTGTYLLEGGKVKEAWLITDQAIDYLQRPSN